MADGARGVWDKVAKRKTYGGLQKRKAKRCIHQSKKEVNEQFGKYINQDVEGNMKLF